MSTQLERLRSLELKSVKTAEQMERVHDDLTDKDKSILALNNKVVLINNKIASWDGGLTLANKAVFLLGALVAMTLGIIKYING